MKTVMVMTELLCLLLRHCERSEAIHRAASGGMDCFVASLPLRKRFAFVAGNDGGNFEPYNTPLPYRDASVIIEL